MKRGTFIVGLLLVATLAVGYFGTSALRGSLLDDASIDMALRTRADVNTDGVLSARELRTSLVDILRGVLLRRDGYDIDGDGAVNRADLTRAKQSLRRLLAATCGDGAVEAGEQCDDGNTQNGDGCSAACAVEQGFVCSGSPSTCAASSCDMPTQLEAALLFQAPFVPDSDLQIIDRDDQRWYVKNGSSLLSVNAAGVQEVKGLIDAKKEILARIAQEYPSPYTLSSYGGFDPLLVQNPIAVNPSTDVTTHLFATSVYNPEVAGGDPHTVSWIVQVNYRTDAYHIERAPDIFSEVVIYATAYDAEHRMVFALTRAGPGGKGTYLAMIHIPEEAPAIIQSWTKLSDEYPTMPHDYRLFMDASTSRIFVMAGRLSLFTYNGGQLSLVTTVSSPVGGRFSQLAQLGDTLLLYNPRSSTPDVLYRFDVVTLAAKDTQQVPSEFVLEGGGMSDPSLRMTVNAGSIVVSNLAIGTKREISVSGLEEGETLVSISRIVNTDAEREYILASKKVGTTSWGAVVDMTVFRQIRLTCGSTQF